MDVRCESCGTEYELDEARVPDEGLQVQCGKCATVFRTWRPTPRLPDARSSDEWMIRQRTGNVFRFRELTTLQRWIVERKVSRDDEISKTAKKWERLGNIPELATFFQVVDQAAAPVAPVTPYILVAASQGAQAQQAVPLPPDAAAGAAWERTPQSLSHAQPTQRWQLTHETAAIEEQYFGSKGRSQDDDLDDVVRKPRRGRAVLAVFVLLVLGATGAYIANPEYFEELYRDHFGGVPEAALKSLTAGYDGLRLDTIAGLDGAIQDFERAIVAAPAYAAAKAGLAEALAARAEYLEEEADALAKIMAKQSGPEAEATKAKIEPLRDQVRERLERAQQLVSEALANSPKALAPNRAAAEVQRVAHQPTKIESYAAQARQAAPDDARLHYVLGAAAALDPSTMERAIRHFDIALEADAQLNRARYKLAQVYVHAGQKEKAVDHLKRLLAGTPTHERAQALLADLEAPPPAPAPAPAPAPTPAEPTQAETPPKGTPSFEQLLAQGDRLRQADRPTQALKAYERALELEPDDADALTGMGWCYVDLENPNAAIATFKQVLDKMPRFSDAHFGLAEAYRMKNMKRDATKHYRAYLDILPDGPEAAVAKRMLEDMSN